MMLAVTDLEQTRLLVYFFTPVPTSLSTLPSHLPPHHRQAPHADHEEVFPQIKTVIKSHEEYK